MCVCVRANIFFKNCLKNIAENVVVEDSFVQRENISYWVTIFDQEPLYCMLLLKWSFCTVFNILHQSNEEDTTKL